VDARGFLILRGVAVWLVIMAVEVVHGVARTLLLAPIVGDFRARQIAVFTGSALILAIAALFIRWMKPVGLGGALAIGAIWLVLTLAFEVAFGRLVVRATWSRIASDYDLAHGGLLPVGLLIETCAPAIAARFRGML
jgi:hypothetical protein